MTMSDIKGVRYHQRWPYTFEPERNVRSQWVATRDDVTLTASSEQALKLKIDAALDGAPSLNAVN